ncbi:MAG: Nif3-like dinuclear metal center hexameric protein [Gemmatimonadetes bacterium]|nr:Nif3-like dinuclear metal center hexameric protein [Gemmatimonadota bacterium]
MAPTAESHGVALPDLVTYLDGYLRISEVPDDPRAHNGLQLENSGSVTRIIAAVDASRGAIHLGVEARGNLLLVHHGLFWGGSGPLVGPHGLRVRMLIAADMAVYSAHLPLDCHREVGNNFVLARKLDVENLRPFGGAYGVQIGVAGDLSIGRNALVAKLQGELGITPRLVPAGPERVSRIGIVTGAGTSELAAAVAEGLDTFLTGEGPHHSYLQAEELGINLIYAGHYATETVGVKALAAQLSGRFGLPWEFVDYPTGM